MSGSIAFIDLSLVKVHLNFKWKKIL